MSWRRERLDRRNVITSVLTSKPKSMKEIVEARMRRPLVGCVEDVTRQQARKKLRDKAFASLPKEKYPRRARRKAARTIATMGFQQLGGDFSKVAQ